MAICPKCKSNITSLDVVRGGKETSFIMYDKENDTIYFENEAFESDGIREIYNCNNCCEELFYSYDEAEAFLSEKDELKEIVAEKVSKDKKKK